MNAQHTPSPWHYWNGEIHANYPNQNGPFVAQLMCLGDRETAANGRLIAASPDLLDALKHMVATHPPCSFPIGAPHSPARQAQEEQEKAIAIARSAIAKAEGREAQG